MNAKKEFSPYSLLEFNTVNIFGEITPAMSALIIPQLQYLDYIGAEEIIVQINSPGGSVADGLAIYDTMNYIRPRIITVGIGMCASMGAFLLSAGSRGYRRATENTEILIHQPLGGAQGQASDIKIAADHIMKTRDRLNRILADNTGKPIRTIMRDTDRDNIMSAQEALKYGLIDIVVPSVNKAKRRENDV